MLCVLDRIGIWKCWFLRRGENRRTRRKMFRSKGENQQQTENCTCLRLVRGLSPVLIALFRWPFHQSTESKETKILITFILDNVLCSLPIAWWMRVTCEYLHHRSKLFKKAIFFKKNVSTALLNHIRELRMKMGPVSRKLWRPRKLRPPELRDSGVFLENSAECWCDGRISCWTKLLKKNQV